MQVYGYIKRRSITMKVMTRLCMAALLTGVVAAGCDKPTPPPDIDSAQQAPTGPTTQDLVSGPRKSVNLAVAALSLKVPQLWDIKHPDSGEFVFLHGPAPHGDVDIQISRIIPIGPVSLDQTQIQNIAAAAKKDMLQNPGNHLVADLRDISGMQLLEVVTADSPATQPADITNQTGCKWRVIVFVPRGGVYDEVSMSVMGFTMGQYRQDGPFLKSIFDSVSQDDSSAGGATPLP
jgi:hypothetical protein